MEEHIHTRGDEKLSLGKTAPYCATAARICASSSGNANLRCASSSESLSYPLPSSESDRVLSAGLRTISGVVWGSWEEDERVFGALGHEDAVGVEVFEELLAQRADDG